MTLHIRQPLPTVKIDALIDEALFAKSTTATYRNTFKRIMDVILVLIAAVPATAITLVFALLVSLDGKSPFYMQKRIGRNGRVFRMWKLRSMVVNADKALAAHLEADPAARVEWDRFQKLSHDPRITKIGRLIRKTSIDELPQLWNVLRGDMSLVGPRPMMPCQQGIYPGTAYYALRPGITGLWQTSVRNESSFSERAGFDTAYLRKLSFATDVKTIFRTFKVVLRGTGC